MRSSWERYAKAPRRPISPVAWPLEAGLPETVPGFTVNRLCASAMQATLCGCQEIWCGQAGVIVAGGAENMSRAPIYLRGSRWGGNRNTLVDSNIEAAAQLPRLYLRYRVEHDPNSGKRCRTVQYLAGGSRRFAVESQRRLPMPLLQGILERRSSP